MFTASFFQHYGVRHACISPGARNSPLSYAFIRQGGIKCYSHVDERSSAFFALGLAKSTKSPVLVISTSGTAAANFFPAVIEASLSRIPTIIISADRPENLIGSGANQSINQEELYGKHVRYFNDAGLPTENLDLLEKILQKAINHSTGGDLEEPPGPVHLNFPFEKPLLPDDFQRLEHTQFSFKTTKKTEINTDSMQVLPKASKPLIIAGPMEENSHQKDIISFAETIQAPILADPLSQIRYGYKNEYILANYDYFLKIVEIQPDLIIRFGRKPTSKILCQLLDRWKQQTYLIDYWKQYNDDCPNFIQAPIDIFCQNQISKMGGIGESNWTNLLCSLENEIDMLIQLEPEYSEATIARVCHEFLKDGDQLIIGNSMPIRDLDMFSSVSGIQIDIYSNRGASGIDGVISTALGISAVDNDRRTLLLIGDLSFYHDMNSLLASKYKMNITIVVINNRGGGIFSFLPIADSGMDKFAQFWTTDTGLDLEKAAKLYNCQYYKTANLDMLRTSIQASFKKEGVQIIESVSQISENVKAHKNFRERVETAITPS